MMLDTIQEKADDFMGRDRLIKRKLKSESGASLMAALLVFVMCACVGSVVLMAGATSAARVSSVETDENKQRYSVESAADYIIADMQNEPKMQISQSWTCELERDEETGEAALTNGQYVLGEGSLSKEFTYTTASGQTGTRDVESYANLNFQSFANLRDILAYHCYAYYWDEISHSADESAAADPWDDMVPSNIYEWSSETGSFSKTAFSISTEEPIKIDVSNTDLMPVYCNVTMDENFVMVFDLYTNNDNGTEDDDQDDFKDYEEWLTVAPKEDEVTVSYSSDDSSRSVAFDIGWSDIDLSSQISTEGGSANANEKSA